MVTKREEIRARLIAATLRVLDEEGPTAVQARRLARDIGTSTMAVYHHFGGMPQLLRGVADDGFVQLDSSLAAVPITDDPIIDIVELALAYRRFAQDSPHLYDLMFGMSAPGGHRPGPSDSGDGEPEQALAFGRLVAATARAMDAGALRRAKPAQVAAQVWSMLHGHITLELAGYLDRFGNDSTDVLMSVSGNLLLSLGGAPEQVMRATAAFVGHQDS